MKKLLILMFTCFALSVTAQQVNYNKELPLDTKTIVGKLPNGITYYIRHNEEPKNRASFYIIRNAGAILENDNENGLAHFLEHMAFNGSKNFPGNSMISTLEKYGVSFGDNLNAYTSQNETVYNISSVPTNNEALIDTCLLILHDWSYYLTLDAKDIDSERGVIAEEWRTRNDSKARILKQQCEYMFKGSPYANRDVIGSLDIIKNFKPETIRNFYHKWYRTDLEAIAICGDFDVKQIEDKIKKIFSTIPAVKNPLKRPFVEIPNHKEIYYSLATDKEQTMSKVGIMRFWKDKPSTGKVTYEDIKDGLIQNFYNIMISSRISEKVQRGEADFLGASIGESQYVRGYRSYFVSAVAKPNMEKEALTAVLQENERIIQYGFTNSELERAKVNVMTSLESALKNVNKTSNESFIDDMKNNFLENSPMFGLEDYCKVAEKIIPLITVKEVSDKINDWWKDDNKIILVSGPSEGVKHLTESETKAIISSVAGKKVEPYKDLLTSGSLIDKKLNGSSIVKTKNLKDFDAVEWTLANGAKVIFRKANYERNSVALNGYSAGGTSLYETKDLLVATNLNAFINAYGLGKYDAVSLRNILTGKTAGCNVGLSPLYETVSGSSTPKDVETMMQLLYLRFEEPRFDSKAHSIMMDRSKIMLAQMNGTPSKMMQDSLRMIFSNYNPRTVLVNDKNIENVTIDKIEKIYKERFTDASDFTFFIVGNVDENVIKPLVEKYIGSIKSTYRKEKWIDRKVRAPKGKVEKIIELPLENPKTTVMISFSKEMKVTLKNNYALSLLSSILNLRYTENIREKEGGTYGVSVGKNISREPVNTYSLSMQFDCEPSRADYLKTLIYKELDNVVKNGVTKEEISKIVKNITKEREQIKYHNSYWMDIINNYYRTGINMDLEKNSQDVLNSITSKDIQTMANEMYNKSNVVDIMFVPKK